MASAAATLMCTLTAGGATPAVDLVPSVGTTPMTLMRLARAIAPARAVRAYAYSGIDDGTAPHRTIEAIAEANLAELRAAAPRGPYLIGGHCLGGTVAHAMAAALEARGEQVAMLVVIDAIAPLPLDHVDDRPAVDSPATAAMAAQIRAISESLSARAVEYQAHVDPEMGQRIKTVVRLHLDASARYRAPALRAPIRVLRTAAYDDAVVQEWDRYSADVSRHTVPGDTVSTLRPPYVEATARVLGRELASASRAP